MVTNPEVQAKLNLGLVIFFVALIPVSLITGWINSVTFVAILSLWALVSGHLGAYEAARSSKDTVEAMVEDDRVPTNDN